MTNSSKVTIYVIWTLLIRDCNRQLWSEVRDLCLIWGQTSLFDLRSDIFIWSEARQIRRHISIWGPASFFDLRSCIIFVKETYINLRSSIFLWSEVMHLSLIWGQADKETYIYLRSWGPIFLILGQAYYFDKFDAF